MTGIDYYNLKDLIGLSLECGYCSDCLYSPDSNLEVTAHIELSLDASCGAVMIYHFIKVLIGKESEIE